VIAYNKQFAQGTFPRSGDWYGLYCEAHACELRKAAVEIGGGSAKNVLDEDEALDILNVPGEPVALLHGLDLRPGKVTTWYRPPADVSTSRQFTSLKKLGQWDMPWSSEPLAMFWTRLPDHAGMRYHMGGASGRQFLFALDEEGHYGGDTTPVIVWSGDVDGDGKLDILMTLPDDNCGFDERLYLSSQAGKGELIHKAAQLSGREAACGC